MLTLVLACGSPTHATAREVLAHALLARVALLVAVLVLFCPDGDARRDVPRVVRITELRGGQVLVRRTYALRDGDLELRIT
jgi:hypothetical protein